MMKLNFNKPIILTMLLAFPTEVARAQFDAPPVPPVAPALDAPAADAPAGPDSTALANPAVRAAWELPRNEPKDYVQAMLNLIALEQPDLARQVFGELLALELNDVQRADLVNAVGPATILRLSRIEALGPEAAEFVDRAMAAAAAAATSPERIGALVEQLGAASEGRQRSAVAALAAMGRPAVVPLIDLLAGDEASTRQREGARAALLRLAPLAEGALLAALDSDNPRLLAEAAELLAALRTPQAAPLLALPAVRAGSESSVGRAYLSLTGQQPTVESATGLLTRTLDRLAGGVPVFRPDDAGNVTYWVWSAKPVDDQKPVPLSLSVADANTLYSARLASDLSELHPEVPSYQSRAIRLQFEAVAVPTGLAPAYPVEELNDLPAGMLDRVLAEALAAGQVAPAVHVLGVIAERRDPLVLLTKDGQPSPTAAALRAPHPNVRLAALVVIEAIDSPSPFPGASYVCPAIARLATASGQRVVVAAAPRFDEAATWAGGLSSLGYSGKIASTGQETFRLAAEFAGVEMVLVDMAIGRPGVRDVLFQLRNEPATALVPIGLLAREPQFARARQIASEHERVMFFPRPHSAEALADVAETLAAELPRDWPTPEERVAQSERAITVMNTLLEQGREFYRLRAAGEVIARTLRPDRATSEAWEVLAKIGTHQSQQALIEFASTASLGIENRQAAAAAFATSIDRFGVLLTTEEILEQYDLYNASRGQPADTQAVLGDLLDAIEAPRAARLEANR